MTLEWPIVFSISMFLVLLEPASRAEFLRGFFPFLGGAVPISGPLLISEPLGFFWPFLQADRSAYSELKSRAVRQTFYLIIQFKFPRFLEVLSNFSFSCNFGLDFFSRFFMSAIHFNSNFRISYGEVLPNFSCDLGLDFFQVFYTSAIHFTSNFRISYGEVLSNFSCNLGLDFFYMNFILVPSREF